MLIKTFTKLHSVQQLQPVPIQVTIPHQFFQIQGKWFKMNNAYKNIHAIKILNMQNTCSEYARFEVLTADPIRTSSHKNIPREEELLVSTINPTLCHNTENHKLQNIKRTTPILTHVD
jgi:hypothetical protein